MEKDNYTYGSKCDRCGEFISDIDAGFCVWHRNTPHENCGGNWWISKKKIPSLVGINPLTN